MLAALAVNWVLLLLRSALSQMDVPTRTSYVMAVVTPAERPAAASVTAVPRSLASAASPILAGYLLTMSGFGWPLVAAGVFLLAMVVVGRVVDVGSHLEAAQGWTAALGVLAPAVYVVVYVAATLIGVPGMPFTLLSPFLFGIGPAFVVMVTGSAISAALGFLIARYLARLLGAERTSR